MAKKLCGNSIKTEMIVYLAKDNLRAYGADINVLKAIEQGVSVSETKSSL